MNDISSTREIILETASRLFAEKGYHETRVSDIADESGTSKGTVYYYFESKEAIFEDMLKRAIEESLNKITELVQNKEKTVQERLYIMAKNQAEFFLKNADISRIIFVQGSPGPEFRRQLWEWKFNFHRAFVEIMEEGIAQGVLRDMDSGLLAHSFLGMLESFGPAYIERDRPAEELARFGLDLFLRGGRR